MSPKTAGLKPGAYTNEDRPPGLHLDGNGAYQELETGPHISVSYDKIKSQMVGPRYKVYVVVDRQFEERLDTLERGVPMWIVDSPTNKPAAQQHWQRHPEPNHLTGVTTFTDIDSATSSELLLAEIDTIDLHHGTYSADPPYTILEVIGANLWNDGLRLLRSFV